jgi:hypothetical protein
LRLFCVVVVIAVAIVVVVVVVIVVALFVLRANRLVALGGFFCALKVKKMLLQVAKSA